MAQWYRTYLESSDLQTLKSLTSSLTSSYLVNTPTLNQPLSHASGSTPSQHQVNFCYAPFIFPGILQVQINGRKKNPCIYFHHFCFVLLKRL